MKIELNDDAVGEIIVEELTNTLNHFKRSLGANDNIFYYNQPEKDDDEIQKHIDALELIIDWYL